MILPFYLFRLHSAFPFSPEDLGEKLEHVQLSYEQLFIWWRVRRLDCRINLHRPENGAHIHTRSRQDARKFVFYTTVYELEWSDESEEGGKTYLDVNILCHKLNLNANSTSTSAAKLQECYHQESTRVFHGFHPALFRLHASSALLLSHSDSRVE